MGVAPAADRLHDALHAAGRVVSDRGYGDELEILHVSNNVVARCGEVVVKVCTDLDAAQRDVAVATHAAARGGPALAPVSELIETQGFGVSLWPYCGPEPTLDDGGLDAGRALAALHVEMAGAPVSLPPLAMRFDAVSERLTDRTAVSSLADRDRAILEAAVRLVVPSTAGSAVLHGEPHDRNRLLRSGSTVYIDFEAACVGPVEWDLAYLPDDIAESVWPTHDVDLRSTLKIGVSACVAIFCSRHVSARPADAEMRRHADHHVSLVRHYMADEL